MSLVRAADYYDLVFPEQPAISPDGETITYVGKKPKDDQTHQATVFVTTRDGETLRQFTVSDGMDSQPRFSPSGDRLAFVSTRGVDEDRPQLWILPTDGGEAKHVTTVPGGIGHYAWRPDGNAIAFTQQTTPQQRQDGTDCEVPAEFESEPPDPRVIDRTVYRTQTSYLDGRRSHVYLLELDETGTCSTTLRRLTSGERDCTSPTWADTERLYYAIKAGEPDPDDSIEYDVICHELDTDRTSVVHTTTGQPIIEANTDEKIAFVYIEPDRPTIRPTTVRTLEVESGDVSRPMDELDRTLVFETRPQWGPDGTRLFFQTAEEGAICLWSVGMNGDHEDRPTRVFRRPGASIHGVDVGQDGVALIVSEWDHPGDLFVCSLDGENPRRLTNANETYLNERTVVEPESVSYDVDGTTIEGWLLTPPEFDRSKSYPLVVEVHGGPHAAYTTSGTMWHEFQTLAARGYVVFWSNPRGSTGHGESYMAAIDGDWGAVTMRDIMAGVDLVCEREYVDGEAVFLTGGSFGGFMIGWMVGQTDRFRAAVAQRGLYDLTGFYGSTDWAYRLVEDDFDAVPWEDASFLWDHSPVGHAHNVSTPTLLIHSDRDFRTPACTAELFYRLLSKHGVETRMVRYPREGHELSRSGEPYHVVDRIERIARWFDGYSPHHEAAPALERDPGDGLTGRSDPEQKTTVDNENGGQ